jgi:hypothetical protein
VALDLVVATEPHAQIPHEKFANRGVVMHDGENRRPGRAPILSPQDRSFACPDAVALRGSLRRGAADRERDSGAEGPVEAGPAHLHQ